MSHEAPWQAIIFDYYMNFIPYFANLFSPLFVFIAVIFFTSKLAENSEIIAMFSTGMSFKRMLRPYMVSAAIIAITTFCLGSYVIPKGSVTRLNFEDKYYKPRKSTTARNIQLEVDSGVIAYIERFEDYSKTGYRFSLDKFKDKQLVSHLTARSITYDTAAVHKWKVKDYMIREMDGMRESIVKGERLDTILFMEPADFLIMKNQQEQQGRRPDRGALDGGEIRGLTAGAKRQIEDQRQRRGRQDIFQAAAENAAQVHLLRGGGRNQSVRYRGDVVAEGRSRYDGADHQRRRGPDQIADGVKNGADHEDGAHRGPGGEGDQAGEQKRGGHELVAQEVELNEIVGQGVYLSYFK